MADSNGNGSRWFNPQVNIGTLLQAFILIFGGLWALGEFKAEIRTKLAVLEERIERKFETVAIELRSVKRDIRDRTMISEDR